MGNLLPPMPSLPAVSALVVNYKSAELARDCVASLNAQSVRAPGGGEGVEVVIVDNASGEAEIERLAGLAVTIVCNRENRGYGAAMNQALASATAPFVLFSNPDTYYFPGALQALVDGIASLARCAGVGPRIYWDLERQFLLPPADAVTLGAQLGASVSQRSPRWRAWRAQRWRRRALGFWKSPEPVEWPMLSGASILTSREALSKVGGFDERFHLYFEDADWCRRARRSGYRLFQVPAAAAAHFYNQSGQQEAALAARRFAESGERYFEKHYGRWWRIAKAIDGRLAADAASLPVPNGELDLGTLAEPPVLAWPPGASGECLLQISPLAECLPAIARFVIEPPVSLPEAVWQRLAAGQWFARLYSLPALRPVACWRWRKA